MTVFIERFVLAILAALAVLLAVTNPMGFSVTVRIIGVIIIFILAGIAAFYSEKVQRNRVQREQAQREQAQREQAQREQAQREQAQREQAQREQAQREQAQREQAQREQAQREQAQREQAQREQAQRERSHLDDDECVPTSITRATLHSFYKDHTTLEGDRLIAPY